MPWDTCVYAGKRLVFLSHCSLDFVLNIFIYLHAYLKKGHACGGQRTTCGIRFSPSTVWAPGKEFRFPGLAESIIGG